MDTKPINVKEFLNKSNYYLGNNKNIRLYNTCKLDLRDISLYHIEEVTFDEKAPRKEALENVLSSMRVEGINFIYLIIGDNTGVHFYFGVARDLYQSQNKDLLSIMDVGKCILEPNIRGNFRGSKIKEVSPEEKYKISNIMDNMSNYALLEGVAGVNEDCEKYQGVDRLVDVMLGDEFGFMIVAKPMNFDELTTIEENLNKFYTQVVPLCKKSVQDSVSQNTGESSSETKGESSSTTESYSTTKGKNQSKTDGSTKGYTDTRTKGTSTSNDRNIRNDEKESNGTSSSKAEANSNSTNTSTSNGTSDSKTEGKSSANGNSSSISKGTNITKGTGSATTREFLQKEYQDWIKYIDDVVTPRLDYGKGKGAFNTTAFLFAKKKAILNKLESTIKSLFAGEKGNKIPLTSTTLDVDDPRVELFKNYQLPHGEFLLEREKKDAYARATVSQYSDENGNVILGNWISSNELSLIAGLPQKEVVGLGLREEVQFGLNIENNIKEENKIKLGNLVHSGNILKNIDVSIDKEQLDKHVFITGVTGSGKTTTCQKILMDSELPFLVIEPAKTEYRILANKYEDILIFTLGRDNVAPFRLNPFEFFKHESITSRVDMLKASMEAAFEMEAAIPQIIESSIYECYKKYGWNISTNENEIFDDPFADGVYAFPTFSDLIVQINETVEKQGFDDRLKNDYIGSIKARLEGLTVGAKGLMLDTRRSIDFEKLLEKKVVLELEEIRSGSEKSLIMGFILTNLLEAIKAKFKKNGEFNHITLVEEAHRLLSKYMPGDSPTKKQGVETFTDMLAEIRKYGESLIIVDQIPNKLTPEVLKNTNTKIVHRIFAQDDKEAIGNTMVLSDEQKGFLSNLEVGRAIVFTQGFQKAVQVQINKTSDTTKDIEPDEKELRRKVIEVYCDSYKKGIFLGLDAFENKPSVEEFEIFNKNILSNKFIDTYREFLKAGAFEVGEYTNVYEENLASDLKYFIEQFDANFVAKVIYSIYYNNKENKEKYLYDLEKFIIEYSENRISSNKYFMNNLGIWR